MTSTLKLTAWEIAALELSLAHAVERGEVEAISGKHLIQKLMDAEKITVRLVAHSMEEQARERAA